MKQCTNCKNIKSLDEFHKAKQHKDGLSYTCKDCSKIKHLEYYVKNREIRIAKQIEYYNKNKESVLSYQADYYETNKEKIKTYQEENRDSILIKKSDYREKNRNRLNAESAVYYHEHQKERIEYAHSYYDKNQENILIKRGIYQKNNPDICNANNSKRRAQKLQATPKWLTQEQYKEIGKFYSLAKELQWLSEEPLEVDHIIPLQGENVSGLHVPWNLQILTKSQNSSKGNKND